MTIAADTLRPVIGLTGGLGSGKTQASGILQELGACIIDADLLTHQALGPGSELLETVERVFGSAVLCDRGGLNRAALAEIVFADAQARARLEEIVHPAVRRLFLKELRERRPRTTGDLFFFSAPLLYESRVPYPEIRRVLVISAPEELCLRRVMASRGYSHQEAQRRFHAQLSPEIKASRADWIIVNDGTLADLRARISAFYADLKNSMG